MVGEERDGRVSEHVFTSVQLLPSSLQQVVVDESQHETGRDGVGGGGE